MGKITISVKVSRWELSETIQKIAFDNEFSFSGFCGKSVKKVEFDYLIFNKKEKSIKAKKDLSYCDYWLPDSMESVIEWLESDLFKMQWQGYDCSYDKNKDKVEIGCEKFNVNELIQFYELANSNNIKNFTYSSGRMGRTGFETNQLFELVKWLKQIKN